MISFIVQTYNHIQSHIDWPRLTAVEVATEGGEGYLTDRSLRGLQMVQQTISSGSGE